MCKSANAWVMIGSFHDTAWPLQTMADNDHLSNKVSIEGRITETGLSVRTKSRAIAAIDRLVGAAVDVPASRMEAYASRVRSQTRLESATYDAAVEKVEAATDIGADAGRLVDEVVASQFQAIANKRHVTDRTVEYLSSSDPDSEMESETDTEELEPDWLNYFGGYAEKATSEKVRDLWARVLAGEIRRPRSFSLATLRLLAELDQQTASWFQEETAFRVGGEYILKPKKIRGELSQRLSFLEEVGLIQYVSPIGGMGREFKPDQNGNAVIFEGEFCLRMQLKGTVQLDIIPITRTGQEIARIFPPVDPKAVLKRIGETLRSKAMSMDICQVLARDHRGARFSHPIEVLKSVPVDSS